MTKQPKPTPPAVARAERAVVRAAVAWKKHIPTAKMAGYWDEYDMRMERAVERLKAARKKGARG